MARKHESQNVDIVVSAPLHCGRHHGDAQALPAPLPFDDQRNLGHSAADRAFVSLQDAAEVIAHVHTQDEYSFGQHEVRMPGHRFVAAGTGEPWAPGRHIKAPEQAADGGDVAGRKPPDETIAVDR